MRGGQSIDSVAVIYTATTMIGCSSLRYIDPIQIVARAKAT